MQEKQTGEMTEQKNLEEQEVHQAAERRQEELAKENKLGTMPVGKLLANVSVPIIFSMLIIALYNVVDSIFVARLGEEALAAVGFVAPVQNLMMAVLIGTGVGVNSLLSRRLGEGNVDSVNRTAVNGLFLGLLSWAGFALVGFFGSAAFMRGFASSPDVGEDLVAMGTSYMRIVTMGSLGMSMSVIFERLLQSTGRSVLTMAVQLTGAIINIILDPIMIFGLLGFPAMGVAGAAYATIIGQTIGCVVAAALNHYKNPEIRLKLRGFRPNGKTVKHIYQVGLPSIVMQSIGSVMTFGINKILIGFGTTPVSVFSIYFKLQGFIFMPVFGISSGMIPIVGYNYGARKRDRIERAVKLSMISALCIMVLGTALFWLLPEAMLRMFDAQDSMMKVGVPALRLISLSFPGAAIGITLSGLFQAMGKGVYSLMMSLVRQLIFLLPLAWLFSQIHGLDTLWLAFPAAEVSGLVLSVIFYRHLHKTMITPLGQVSGV